MRYTKHYRYVCPSVFGSIIIIIVLANNVRCFKRQIIIFKRRWLHLWATHLWPLKVLQEWASTNLHTEWKLTNFFTENELRRTFVHRMNYDEFFKRPTQLVVKSKNIICHCIDFGKKKSRENDANRRQFLICSDLLFGCIQNGTFSFKQCQN